MFCVQSKGVSVGRFTLLIGGRGRTWFHSDEWEMRDTDATPSDLALGLAAVQRARLHYTPIVSSATSNRGTDSARPIAVYRSWLMTDERYPGVSDFHGALG